MTENSRANISDLENGCDDCASPDMEKATALLEYIKNSKMPLLRPYERQHLTEYLIFEEKGRQN